MNRVFLLCFIASFFFSLSGFAQAPIVVDEGDMPSAGDQPRHSIADTLIVVDPKPTGANHIWDFSNLTPQYQEVDSFIGRNDLPFTLRFSVPSSADMAQYIRTSADSLPLGGLSFSGGYQVYDKSSTDFNDLGQATLLNGLLPVFFEKDPVDVIYRFPLNFGDTDSVFSIGILDLQIPTIGSIYMQQDRIRESEVDGWGTLTTPYGTFDVLRVRSEIMGEDSIMFDTLFNFKVPAIPQVEYKWIAKGMDVPVLQINVTALGGTEVVTQVIYQDSLRPEVPTLGLEDKLDPLVVQVYPNPATEHLQIQIPDLRGQTAQIRLFDLQGRLVSQSKTRHESTELALGHLAFGQYVLEITTVDRFFIDRIIKK